MKPTLLLLFVILLMFTSSINAQEEQLKTAKRVSISDIFIQTGTTAFPGRSIFGSLTDFRMLAPQSVLLNSDFSDYSSSSLYESTQAHSMMMGLKFRVKEDPSKESNSQLRIGLSYFSGTTRGFFYKDSERKTFDTLVSNQTGQVYYIDSITSESTSMDYSSEQLRFEGSLLFSTDQAARWSFFTGIGFSAGISINTQTDVNKLITTYQEINGKTYYNGENLNSSSERDNEQFRNKGNFGASAYIPIGIDFRIGKKGELCKRTHLFYELRPNINITSIPELRTYANTNIQHGIGLKFTMI
ncbi:MAG TPA: hypothetical protein EYN89_13130 [Flavobacteriales bacterium]|nr:hypothetical protein [Flavobacteriales bacterium]